MTAAQIALLSFAGIAVGGFSTFIATRLQSRSAERIAAKDAEQRDAARTNTGHIDQTEAATLWVEAEAMRKEWREEALALRIRVEKQDEVIAALHKENREQADAMRTQAEHTKSLQDQVDALTKRVDDGGIK